MDHKHLTPEEIENIKEQIRVISKSQKEMKEEIDGDKKGAATAERLMQLTLGMSQVYNGPGGKKLLGILKGMRKQLKKSLTFGNLLATTIGSAVEFFFQADKASEQMFRKQTILQGQTMIAEQQRELLNAGLVDPLGKLAQINMTLKQNIQEFDKLSGSRGFAAFAARSAELVQIGADINDVASISSVMTGVFKDNAMEMQDNIDFLYGVSGETGRSVKETAKDMAALMPTYVKFGKQSGMEMFRRISNAAKITNVDVVDLMKLTESLDNSEDALEQAARFNALLGGEYLNGVQLLAADPDQKLKLIADAYQKAEANLGSIDKNIKRELYANFNMEGSKFQSLVQGNFDDFDKKMSKEVKPPSTQDRIKDLQNSFSKSEAFRAQISRAAGKIMSAFIQNTSLMGAVRFAADNIHYLLPILLGYTTAQSLYYAYTAFRGPGTPGHPKSVVMLGGPGGGAGGGGSGKGTKPKPKPRVRAPKGGVTVNGKFYKGGQFLPPGTQLPKPPSPPSPPKPKTSFFGRLKASVAKRYNQAKKYVSNKISSAKKAIVEKYQAAKESAKAILASAKQKLTSAYQASKGGLSAAYSKMKSIGKYLKEGGAKLYNDVSKGLTKFTPKEVLKTVKQRVTQNSIGLLRKAAGLAVFSAIFEGIFTHMRIVSMIKGGVTGEPLFEQMGRDVLGGLAGVIGGVAGSVLVTLLSATGVPTFLLNTAAFMLGDVVGRFIANKLMDLAPSIAPKVGKMFAKTFYSGTFKKAGLNPISGLPLGSNPEFDRVSEFYSGKDGGLRKRTTALIGKEQFKQAQRVNEKMSSYRPSMPFDDTDSGPMTTAPMKKRKFENSNNDGLLLESIYNTVEKIKQASAMLNTNVVLEVDGRVIGATGNG